MKSKNLNGEGSYYYLASRQRWMVQYRDLDGRNVQRVARPQSEAGARAMLRKLISDRERGGDTPARSPTLAEFTETWLESKRVARCRPRTIEAYRERLSIYVLPILGKLKLDRLTPTHVETLYGSLKTRTGEPLSPATVNSVHLALGNLLRLAHRRRYVPRVVTSLVTPPRSESYEARTLTIDEARTLIAGLSDNRHGPLWIFMLGTGCRFGEAVGLTWDNVDLAVAQAHIVQQATRERDQQTRRVTLSIAPVKTRAGKRVVALPSFVVAALHRQKEILTLFDIKNPQNLVFPSRSGELLPENSVNVCWHRAMRDLGLETPTSPPLRMHDLRHTKGTLMADAGEELTTIQKTLGHARISITADTYVGNTSTALKRAADRFGALLNQEED